MKPVRTHTIPRLLAFAVVIWLLFSALRTRAAAMPPFEAVRAEFIQWEGYHVHPYKDRGEMSVGIGHCLTINGETVKSQYSRTEIERLFTKDISWSLDACRAGIRGFDSLPVNVQMVALAVAFTTGRTGFVHFKSFRLALSYRAYNAASTELATSVWAAQVSPDRLRHCVGILRRQP